MNIKIIGTIAAVALVGVGTGTAVLLTGHHGGNDAVLTESFSQPGAYTFQTVDDKADPTFNQLLGVNNDGLIAGYFGSGAAGHPNKGFTLRGNAFGNENVPNSTQTQVTGLNDRGVTVGFSSNMNNASQVNDNFGFVADDGRFRKVDFPTADNANPPVNQLLGVNDEDVAVGFYTDAAGNNHAYQYDADRRVFYSVKVSGATSATAAAIDNNGDVAGFSTDAAGTTNGFLRSGYGKMTVLAYPGATMTQALGVNDHREVVGVYTVGSGAGAQTHGFTWTAANGFLPVDDPSGVGATTVNGVNNDGTLVGFYTDAAGNTHGMLASPRRTTKVTSHLTLRAMPVGSVSLSHNTDGTLSASLNLYGLTPGSSHKVDIERDGAVAVRFADVTADGTGQLHTTVTSTGTVRSLPYGGELAIRLGDDGSQLAAETIASTGTLPDHLTDATYQLHAVGNGQLSGHVTTVFDPTAHTLTLTVDATGLTPGMHAAHIHAGSCASQGAVQYMLMDLQANEHGNVVHQTRVVSGVPALPAPGTWYVNIHQGDSNTILANGAPALPFRPVLCANF
jgi:hypothetical protein